MALADPGNPEQSVRSAPTGELAAVELLTSLLPGPPLGEVWLGDDAAVVSTPNQGHLLLCADAVVAGVHADLNLTGLDDLGWKAMVANLSDIAAMGGEPGFALVSVAGPAGTDIALLYSGIQAAANEFSCPVVGGDLTSCSELVVSIAMTGTISGEPVRRSGASPGDSIWLTGRLGASSAGLRGLRQGLCEPSLVNAHARPCPRLREGVAARVGGVTAMIDISDGLSMDLCRLADASGVGLEILDVPIAAGATLEDAVGGGEDYELVFTAPEEDAVLESFRGLRTPILIGRCLELEQGRTILGKELKPIGWEHPW